MYGIVSHEVRTWFDDSIICIAMDDYVEVTTPFLNSHNDLITIYVTRDGDNFLLTDDGETLGMRETYGYDVDSKEARERFEKIARMTGCYLENYELRVKSTERNLGFNLNRLAVAMTRISDLELAEV